jgi:hypothetical protein
LKRRSDTSDGSGGASPTVVTSRRDDDDDLTAAGDQPTEIIAADANGTDRPDSAAADPSPAMPADSIKPARGRTPTSSSRPAAAPADPESDGWKPADPGTTAAETDPAGSKAAPAAAGNGRTSDGTMFGTGSSGAAGSTGASGSNGSPASTGSPSDGTSPGPEAVSAAAFAWDSPESSSTSAPSAARNFLRASAVRASAASRRPAATVRSGASSHAAPPSGQPSGPPKRSARQAHLTVARVEPWSVMKFSFLVSLIAFVILFVAVAVIFGVLSALGVFTSLQHVVQSLTSSQGSAGVDAANWFTASRVLGYTALLGSLNIVLITAMSTIGAVIYNLTSRLIGGVEVTLRETE